MTMKVKSSWILIVAATLFLMDLLVFRIGAVSPQGFVSIDCGGSGGIDRNTGLEWTSDGDYLQAVAELKKEGVTINATVTLAPSSPGPIDNAERLKTALIFFPGNSDRTPRSKYCYALPVEPDASGESPSYMLRATFPSRNLKIQAAEDINGETIFVGAYSTRFYFTVDSTFISTVDLDESDPQTIELIISPIDSNVSVCLIPLEDMSSMPAISALELRPFAPGMYARSFDLNSDSEIRGRQKSYLITIVRWNFGGDPDLPSLRYPADVYDRLWTSPRVNSSDIISLKNVTQFTIGFDETASVNPPMEVMGTAWEATSLGANVAFSVNKLTPAGAQQATNYYYNILLADVFDTTDATRIIDLYYDEGNGMTEGFTDVPIDHRNETRLSSTMMNFLGDFVRVEIRANVRSMLPPLINAVELYGEFGAVRMRTLESDVGALRNFTSQLPDELDGAGDPCLPIPWAWLVCSIELPPRISQINLTSKGVGGNLPLVFGRLRSLTVLDLSNNSFSGNLPGSIGNISALRALHLERNNLTGDIPIFPGRSLQNLETLSLSMNRLSGELSSLVSALDDSLSYLNLSNNIISGPIPLEMENWTSLHSLDLSNNQLSGIVEVNMIKLQRLETMDLNNNRLEGTVPDSIWGNSNLEYVNLDRNMFTELNLTTWYFSVMNAKSFHAYQGRQKVWLVGNKIRNIIVPSLEDLDNMLVLQSNDERKSYLYNPTTFILLADNPWCKEREGRNSTLTSRYFCRSNENQDFWPSFSRESDGDVSARTYIFAGVILGVLALIIIFILVFFLRKMQRRNRELQQIQEALAKEHVKPPFFNYNDLKMATQNFSTNSVIGKGGFGTVHKAELPDGSIVAVKRLNPTKQSTSDFLKEMVNITGIKHKHLIQLKGCCVREKERMLVYEYAENNNLANALWGQAKPFMLSWEQRFDVCLGIARGLAYLHEELQPKMIHRDIKPQNILLDKDFNAKIADFGLVRPATTDNTQITVHIGGTRGYCSPEYLNEGIISEKLDVYSYGVVLLEIISGRVCIDYKLPEEQIVLRTWALKLYDEDKLLDLVDEQLMGSYNEQEVLLVLQIALACCQLDSKNRPIMSEVVNTFMKRADIAIDILRELKGDGPNLENTLEYNTRPDATDYHLGADKIALIALSSTDGSPITELSGR